MSNLITKAEALKLLKERWRQRNHPQITPMAQIKSKIGNRQSKMT